MAHIKCRYTLPFCTNFNDIRVRHSDFWFCDAISDECPHQKLYERPKNADPMIGNIQCVYCKYKSGEFEKTVKKYEYFDGDLTVAGDTFCANEIDYLEIDGRILVEQVGNPNRLEGE